jgi:hypothetical protein
LNDKRNLRQFPRVSYKQSINFLYKDKEHPNLSAKNISVGGIYIYFDGEVVINDPAGVIITVTVADTEVSLEIDGHVARQGSDGFAIRFPKLEGDTKKHLDNYMQFRLFEE